MTTRSVKYNLTVQLKEKPTFVLSWEEELPGGAKSVVHFTTEDKTKVLHRLNQLLTTLN